MAVNIRNRRIYDLVQCWVTCHISKEVSVCPVKEDFTKKVIVWFCSSELKFNNDMLPLIEEWDTSKSLLIQNVTFLPFLGSGIINRLIDVRLDRSDIVLHVFIVEHVENEVKCILNGLYITDSVYVIVKTIFVIETERGFLKLGDHIRYETGPVYETGLFVFQTADSLIIGRCVKH